MKKGEIYEAIVEKVEFPNKGIVHVGEEKVIVKNALPQSRSHPGLRPEVPRHAPPDRWSRNFHPDFSPFLPFPYTPAPV